MELQTLRPFQILLKYIGIPVLAFIGFVIYVFLRGFSGNKYQAVQPTVINLGFPLWLVIVCMLTLFIIVVFIIRFYQYNGVDDETRIKISSQDIVIETPDYLIPLRINKARKIRFTDAHLFGLFYRYYMVGRLTINYEGDRYTFYFPVKTPEEERQIIKWISK